MRCLPAVIFVAAGAAAIMLRRRRSGHREARVRVPTITRSWRRARPPGAAAAIHCIGTCRDEKCR